MGYHGNTFNICGQEGSVDRSLKTVVMDVKRNFDVHSINTRHKADLFPPTSSLSKYHKGVYYSGIKIFNHLPQHIKQLSRNIKKFKSALKRLLLLGSFYTLEEYYDWNLMSDLGT